MNHIQQRANGLFIQPAQRTWLAEEYYFSRKLAEVRKLDTPQYRVINLGIGNPDLPPAPEVIAELRAVARDANSHGYQSYRGIPALREAIASFMQLHYNVSLQAESMILPLMGSKEGIFHITQAFVNPGDKVLVPDPGYPAYSAAAHIAGAEVIAYPVHTNHASAVAIHELRNSLHKVKLMWINFPHMPTGVTASAEEFQSLVDLAHENRFLIVHDNPYSFILNKTPQSILTANGAAEVALELHSLSKSHNMAGWRVGWVAGKPEYLDAILRIKSNMDSGMFLGIQRAAIAALRLGRAWYDQQNFIYSRRKELATEILRALSCSFTNNQSGMFVWAKVPDSVENVETWIDAILYEAKVFIAPGFIFGPGGNRYVRLSLCCPEADMQEALKRITHFVKAKR
ncbi:MAG: aminotransferase [Chitinophagales bacterium]|nr:MAG: aminotransferase [Chitinophagales bacterium]